MALTETPNELFITNNHPDWSWQLLSDVGNPASAQNGCAPATPGLACVINKNHIKACRYIKTESLEIYRVG